jgi:hypothetical protein
MISFPVFAPDFRRHSTATARRAYVADELRRVQQDGPLSLASLLFGGEDGAASIALDLLADGYDDGGQEVAPAGYAASIKLRLREGVSPPDRDPQGRRLPPEKVGKVLVAKVGNVRREHGDERERDERVGRDLYRTVEVTAQPRAYRLADAVTILRQWGVGSPDHTAIAHQLVVEVLDVADAPKHTTTDAPKRGR